MVPGCSLPLHHGTPVSLAGLFLLLPLADIWNDLFLLLPIEDLDSGANPLAALQDLEAEVCNAECLYREDEELSVL